MDEGQWRRRETAEEQNIFPDAIIADPVAKGSTGHHRFSAVSGDSCKLLVLLLVLTVTIPVMLRCSGGDPVLAGWSLSLLLVFCLFGFTCFFSTAATPLTIIFVSLSYGGLLAYFAGNLLSDVLGMVIMYLDSMLAAGFFGSALAQHRQGNGAPLFVANDHVPMTQEKKRPLYILQGVLALGSAAGLLWMMLPISDYSPLGVAGNLFFALTIILWTNITCVLHWLNGALSVDDSGCIVLAWFFHVCALCFFFLVFMGELIAAIVLWLGLLASAAFLGYCLRIHASYEQIMIDRNVGTCPLANLDDNKTLGMSVELTRRNHSPSSPLNYVNANNDPIMSEDPLVNLDDNKVLGVSVEPTCRGDADVHSHAASNLVSEGSLEQTVQQILDMGGGTWERDMAVRALRAAYNNPERAIDYLYSGIPESVEALPVAPRAPAPGQQAPSQAQAAPLSPVQPSGGVSAGPNAANSLNLIPQGVPSGGGNPGAGVGAGAGALDALRQLQEFQALLALVRANPQILQPMLQELGKQNPQILRLIQENQAEFLRLVNETPESGAGGNIQGAVAAELPQKAVQVTPEERDAIQRLEAMGFNRELVLEVLFACNRDEELAANYLLDHGHEFEEMQ